MSAFETFVLAVLGTIPAILAGIAALLVALQKIREVHTIVNSQRTEMMQHIEELKKTIADRRVEDARKGEPDKPGSSESLKKQDGPWGPSAKTGTYTGE
jgi:hypothetical protein